MSKFSMNTGLVRKLAPEVIDAANRVKVAQTNMMDVFRKVGIESEMEILGACAKGIEVITEEVTTPNMNEIKRVIEELEANAVEVDNVTNL